ETSTKESIINKALQILEEDIKLCDQIAQNGAELINDGDTVITHCNTGGLATAGIGTALGVLNYAFKKQNKKIHVIVDETRPLLQGGRLTTWELQKLGIPYTLITDSMAATLMKSGKINKAIVGCDRIALNGDFANKIGTYSLAVNCFYHQIPFFVAGPYTTIDFDCNSGVDIPIEERISNEVKGFVHPNAQVLWAPELANVYNPAFDVTPAKLVSSWILDSGNYNKDNIYKLKELRSRG
ncbi:MAG: S-methyl-5-thioribose-1-phosphate isomerase, partial [Bdellovibrionales bacterium]|nr:S-methyl-5-thioribose-1-phosphate isomerase [Bdellovibrionales bacterium]